jgi:adenine-specific DNA-methyltransferase
MNFIENETAQKLRGGYYTPSDLAIFLAHWIKEIGPRRVLEPSCGDGVFFQALATIDGFQETDVLGFELEANEAAKAETRAKALGLLGTIVFPEDFLGWALDNMIAGDPFDAVLGNPPFVRYQYLPEPFQARAEQVFKQLNLPFTKHTKRMGSVHSRIHGSPSPWRTSSHGGSG